MRRQASATLGLAAVLALGTSLLGGCAGDVDPAPPAAVVVHAPVAVAKAAAPAPPPDLATLPVVDPLSVVAGLPGTDGLQPRRNADPALGLWQTAVVARPTAAYDRPDGTPVGVLPTTTLSEPTTLPVLDERDGWLRVLVATRGALPSEDRAQVNGRTAWVRAADTTPSGTDWSIHVDTAAQTITVTNPTGSQSFPVKATGSTGTPTPAGLSFLLGVRWLEPGTTTPRVLPLSTQSETIDHYDKPTGTAVTAIHTTTLRGTGPVSNGCVRVDDEVLDLVWQAPAGTVVTVG
ncbi:L,D-transpeptidase family protein [Cellulomonas sp. URHB0016]